MHALGRKNWVVPGGYIPYYGTTHRDEEMESQERLCITNCDEKDAKITLYIYFEDQDPLGPYHVTVPSKRVKHVKINDLKDPEVVPYGVHYSCVIEGDRPVVVQHFRLDSRQCENAISSNIPYCE